MERTIQHHLLIHPFESITPKTIGKLWIVKGDVCINLPHKPNWFHLLMMHLFFGFVWEDIL